MRRLVVGVLAHVDAGKTTLAESLLFLTGRIRNLGRVDHKNAYLDTYELERARGITIFSKQAELRIDDIDVTLLDTPGHVDFSSEMERTLQVLDYAILVISGSDGVQGHTETLWRLLARYGIPTFLFINKMDIALMEPSKLMEELKNKLSDACVDFSRDQEQELFMENLAVCDESLLDQYMTHGLINLDHIGNGIAKRRVFPCYFGSALKLTGVQELIEGLVQYTITPNYPNEFGAKVFKITRDDQGNRLTYMKITGGSLKVKMPLSNQRPDHSKLQQKAKAYFKDNSVKNEQLHTVLRSMEDAARSVNVNSEDNPIWEEKVDQIRIYSGLKYDTVEEAKEGDICAVTGLSRTYPGQGLGIEAGAEAPILKPVLSYQLILPTGSDVSGMLMKLRQLEEEDPLLHIVWNEGLKEIHVQLMGEVQIDILKSQIMERFNVEVDFGAGNIVYKETIQKPVVGMGHFEPLRHYAEVHLLMEPGEPGSGLSFDTRCSEDDLDRNWQRLVLTHLEEKEHIGVLTGSPITDMKITLIAGRAHQKHTEGGDFRQATYRALRQGLMKAKSILLEPYYNYRLELPSDAVGRAMTDIGHMGGTFGPPLISGDMSVLSGTAPVSAMQGYHSLVIAYTKGRGRLICSLKGYEPCQNEEEVIASIGYDSERDLDNPAGSVFCSHGAGFVVAWNKVQDYMHIENEWKLEDAEVLDEKVQEDRGVQDRGFREGVGQGKDAIRDSSKASYNGSLQEDKELEEIFTRTFGPVKERRLPSQSSLGYERGRASTRNSDTNKNTQDYQVKDTVDSVKDTVNSVQDTINPVKDYLLVDGYNIIFAWEELSELAQVNIEAARMKLMDLLCNYQGFKNNIVILVFDAYKVKGGIGEVYDYQNIHVVYTKEAETADMYIEKVTHEIGRKHHVVVATSDRVEQMIIMGQGAVRLSAMDLKKEMLQVSQLIRDNFLNQPAKGRIYLGDRLTEEIKNQIEE